MSSKWPSRLLPSATTLRAVPIFLSKRLVTAPSSTPSASIDPKYLLSETAPKISDGRNRRMTRNGKVLSKNEAAINIDESYNRLNLCFEDGKEAFKSKTNLELLRALLVFQMCSIDFLVRNNQRILATMRRVLGERLFKLALRSTFFGHFVAGETQKEVAAVTEKLSSYGVRAILDYSVEADIDGGGGDVPVRATMSSKWPSRLLPSATSLRVVPILLSKRLVTAPSSTPSASLDPKYLLSETAPKISDGRSRRMTRNGKVLSKNEAAMSIDESYNRLNLSFEDGKEAFKSKTNLELLRALLVFQMCSIDFLVRNNQRILATMRRVLGERLFELALRSTFFGHFVAGETQKEVAAVTEKLSSYGVRAILDYSVEADIDGGGGGEKRDGEGEVLEEAKEVPLSPVSPSPALVDGATIHQTHQRYSSHEAFRDRRADVVSARTYVYSGEEQCDKNMQTFCGCIDAVAQKTSGQGFIAIKLTALGRPQLLLRLSKTIAQTQNFFRALTGSTWETLVLSRISEDDFMQRLSEFGIKTRMDSAAVRDWFKVVDFDADGFVDFYDWGRLLDGGDSPKGVSPSAFQVLNIKNGRLEPLVRDLSKAEEKECNNMMQRMRHVADYSAQRGIRIMIDAEQTYFQPAITRLTMALMRRYNKAGGHILNTYQAYLRDTLGALQVDMQLARRDNFHFGAKLVRGAYMEQERKRAQAVGYEDPINESYEATSSMYHRCLDAIVAEHKERGPGSVSVMVASHNEESVRYAVELMRKHGIHPAERVVCFAQLYGMCDQVSFSLGQAGYSIYKYLPYGPLEGVLPYLSRRALENGAVLKKSGKEKAMLWAELKRRWLRGQFTHPVAAAL